MPDLVTYPIDRLGLGRYDEKDDIRRGLGVGDSTDACFTLGASTSSHCVATITVHGTQDPIVSSHHAHALGRNNGAENCVLALHDKATRHQGGGDTRNGDGSGNGLGVSNPNDPMYTLTTGDRHAVCFQQNASGELRESDIAYTLNTNSNASGRNTGLLRAPAVRRLTPVECERLQGLPDNYTQIPYRGKPKEDCPVSKRYEACGRAMSVNVMEWLGSRIKQVHNGEI